MLMQRITPHGIRREQWREHAHESRRAQGNRTKEAFASSRSTAPGRTPRRDDHCRARTRAAANISPRLGQGRGAFRKQPPFCASVVGCGSVAASILSPGILSGDIVMDRAEQGQVSRSAADVYEEFFVPAL